jgi:small-conductance mechanosensitive channel
MIQEAIEYVAADEGSGLFDAVGRIWGYVTGFMNVELFPLEGGGAVKPKSIIVALLVLWAAAILSKVLRGIMDRRVFPKFNLDVGLRYAFLQFLHYFVLVAGVYMALEMVGLPMGMFLGVFALLSVGIGFGLQNIASNFISGLILLLERPVQIDDRIEVAGYTGNVKKISLRTTVIETTDRVSILVPNAHLLENEVTNWSYGDKRVRIHVPVGVAYGSDVDLVTKLLLEVAANEGGVLTSPEPNVHFLEFADSSLNFELICWTPEVAVIPGIKNKLNRGIDKIFRDNGVEIPFPQRVVHMPAGAGA